MLWYNTTVYKAGLSTVEHLYNLVTKNVTKYAVQATLKILKIKKNISNFFNFENFKVARTTYFVTFFVTRLYKCSTLLKPALYTVVQFSKTFFRKISKILPIF